MQNLDPKVVEVIKKTAAKHDMTYEEVYNVVVSNFNWLRRSMTKCEYPAYRIPHLGCFKMYDYRPRNKNRLRMIETEPIYVSYAKWINSINFTDGGMMYVGKHNLEIDYDMENKTGICNYKVMLDEDAHYLEDIDAKIEVVNKFLMRNVIQAAKIIEDNIDDLPKGIERIYYINHDRYIYRWNPKYALCSFTLSELNNILKLIEDGQVDKTIYEPYKEKEYYRIKGKTSTRKKR